MSHYIAEHEQRLFRVMLTMSGHSVSDFRCQNSPDGRVIVQGPTSTALYEGEHWLSPFARDLYAGVFKPSKADKASH